MNELLICFLLAIPFGGGTCIYMLGVSGWLDDIFEKIENKISKFYIFKIIEKKISKNEKKLFTKRDR